MNASGRLLVAVLILVAVLPLLGGAFHEPDEGRYAEMAREMLVRGDFLVPRLGEEEHLTKPPLTYWTIAASLALFGVSVQAARLPVILAGLGTILLVRALGRRLFDARVGDRAALILATGLYGFIITHYISTDVFILFLQTLGVLAAVAFAQAPTGGRGRWRLLFWLAFGLSFLAKGPPGLLALPATLLWLRRRKPGEAMVTPTGVGLFLLVALSWYVAIVLRDPERLRYFLYEEVWQRVATDHHNREHSPLIYLAILVAGPLPWIGAHRLWLGGWRTLRAEGRAQDAFFLLAVWFLPALLVFALARSRMILYLGPIFVPLVIAMAAASRSPRPVGARRVVACLAAALVLVALQVSWRELGKGGEERRLADRLHELAAAGPLVIVDRREADASGLDFLLHDLGRTSGQRPSAAAILRVGEAGEVPGGPRTVQLVRARDLDFCRGFHTLLRDRHVALIAPGEPRWSASSPGH